MATTSYGKITIIDITDVGNFSVYPYANGPNTQIYSEENNTYYPDWSANGSHLVLTPVVTYAGQDKTAEATVNWYLKTDLEHPITTGFNSTYKTLTISNNIPTANTYIVYVVKASYNTDTGAHVEAEGEITFNLLTQPSSIKNVNISGTNVIKYASDSTTPNPSSVMLTATLTGGANITGDGWQYWDGDSWENVSGVTGLTVNNTNLTVAASYTNNAAYFNADIARFKYVAHATSDNTDIYEDIFTVMQLRDGASGSNLVTMDLTNDDQLIPIDQNDIPLWDVVGSLASTTVHIYEGSTDITADSTKVSSLKVTLTNVAVELYNGSTKYTGTWNSGSNLPSGYYTVKVVGFTNNATVGSARFEAVVNGLNYDRTFSLVGQKAGIDGKTPTIYALDFPSIPAYVNNPTGSASAQTLTDNWTYSPANLTIKAYEITTDSNGVSTRSPYGGRIYYTPKLVNGVPEESGGSRTWGVLDLPTSGANKGVGTLAASTYLSPDYSPYTFRLVGPSQTNTTANIKDEENINIVSDGYTGNAGNSGDDAINLLINNENVTLNCTEGGKTRSQTITCGYQGYVGTREDSNFALASSSSYSSSKSGLVSSVTDNAGHTQITINLAPNVSVVKGETGTITLNFVYSGGNTPLTISKIISWDAKLDAKDGSDAVILTFEYSAPSGQVPSTYFKNEIGQTKVTPVLLQNGNDILDNTYTVVWTDLITNTTLSGGDIDSDGITAIIDASDIAGVGSYSCTVSKNNVDYMQYISFTDYSDPLQVELISTIGDKLTNGVGEGVVYPQTTRDGAVLDQVSTNSLVVWGSTTAPSSPKEGDFYFNTGSSSLILYKRESSSWVQNYDYDQIIVLSSSSSSNPIVVRNLNTSTHKYSSTAELSTLTYVWSFRDLNGNVINPQTLTDLKVSYTSGNPPTSMTSTDVTGGQFIYVNKNVVDKKIVILCKVTKN